MSRSEVSRVSLLENPPKLADDVLKQLLDEARQQGITSRNTPHSTDAIAEGDGNSKLNSTLSLVSMNSLRKFYCLHIFDKSFLCLKYKDRNMDRYIVYPFKICQQKFEGEIVFLKLLFFFLFAGAQMDNDTIRELLNNSRATSRTALSRPSSSSTVTLTQESQERETWAQKQQQPQYQQQQQQHNTPREPFLPKIDPKGSLITSSLSSMSTISSLSSSQHTPVNQSVVSLSQSVDSESHELTGDRGGPSPPRYPHPPPRSGGAAGDGGRRFKML